MTRNERIRFIFRKRRRFTRSRAATALGKSMRWVEKNRFSREHGGFISWEEMVLMAYLLWTRLQIQRALGDDAASVFPRLARLVPLTVHVPENKVLALRHEARQRRSDVSELVSDGISVSRSMAEHLELRHPGYIEAWDFPYRRAAPAAAQPSSTEQRRSRRRVVQEAVRPSLFCAPAGGTRSVSERRRQRNDTR